MKKVTAMPNDDSRKDDPIDFDELDEMPDVVMGENTRVMKVMHEKGVNPQQQTDEDTGEQTEEKVEEPAEITAHTSAEPAPIKEDTSSSVPHLSREQAHLDAMKRADEIVEQPREQEEVSEDTQSNTMKHALSNEDEIPESLTDDDPGVKDELSDVYQKEEENQETQVLKTDSPKEEKLEKPAKSANAGATQQTSGTAPLFEDIKEESEPHDADNDTVAQLIANRKTPMKQKVIAIILAVFVALLLFGGWNVYQGFQPEQTESETVSFTVSSGETMKTITQNLQDQGIIRNAEVAYVYARYKKYDKVIYGQFSLDKSWTLDRIFTTLSDADKANAESASVTIVEGDWAKDAAAKIAKVTNVTSDDLIALWSNKEWIESEMTKYPFLTEDMFKDGVRIYMEGYLAPNTYYFDSDTTAEAVTEKILDQSLAVYQKYADQITASGRSIADIYTMASIIQYEAGSSADDLKNVAGVFYNRLAADMPLQSSVTVCYAIDFDKQSDNWQACEVNSDYDSPYNTYKNKGLPPGPIENAGETAIEAAINPADNDYYYFMADVYGDGTIYYAKTYEEHEANVAKYLNK
jgi:UPF0755 protein